VPVVPAVKAQIRQATYADWEAQARQALAGGPPAADAGRGD
jgi:hypothetical protein